MINIFVNINIIKYYKISCSQNQNIENSQSSNININLSILNSMVQTSNNEHLETTTQVSSNHVPNDCDEEIIDTSTQQKENIRKTIKEAKKKNYDIMKKFKNKQLNHDYFKICLQLLGEGLLNQPNNQFDDQATQESTEVDNTTETDNTTAAYTIVQGTVELLEMNRDMKLSKFIHICKYFLRGGGKRINQANVPHRSQKDCAKMQDKFSLRLYDDVVNIDRVRIANAIDRFFILYKDLIKSLHDVINMGDDSEQIEQLMNSCKTAEEVEEKRIFSLFAQKYFYLLKQFLTFTFNKDLYTEYITRRNKITDNILNHLHEKLNEECIGNELKIGFADYLKNTIPIVLDGFIGAIELINNIAKNNIHDGFSQQEKEKFSEFPYIDSNLSNRIHECLHKEPIDIINQSQIMYQLTQVNKKNLDHFGHGYVDENLCIKIHKTIYKTYVQNFKNRDEKKIKAKHSYDSLLKKYIYKFANHNINNFDYGNNPIKNPKSKIANLYEENQRTILSLQKTKLSVLIMPSMIEYANGFNLDIINVLIKEMKELIANQLTSPLKQSIHNYKEYMNATTSSRQEKIIDFVAKLNILKEYIDFYKKIFANKETSREKMEKNLKQFLEYYDRLLKNLLELFLDKFILLEEIEKLKDIIYDVCFKKTRSYIEKKVYFILYFRLGLNIQERKIPIYISNKAVYTRMVEFDYIYNMFKQIFKEEYVDIEFLEDTNLIENINEIKYKIKVKKSVILLNSFEQLFNNIGSLLKRPKYMVINIIAYDNKRLFSAPRVYTVPKNNSPVKLLVMIYKLASVAKHGSTHYFIQELQSKGKYRQAYALLLTAFYANANGDIQKKYEDIREDIKPEMINNPYKTSNLCKMVTLVNQDIVTNINQALMLPQLAKKHTEQQVNKMRKNGCSEDKISKYEKKFEPIQEIFQPECFSEIEDWLLKPTPLMGKYNYLEDLDNKIDLEKVLKIQAIDDIKKILIKKT